MTTQENDLFIKAIERIVSEDMELGRAKIASKELFRRIAEQEVEIPFNVETILKGMGFVKASDSGDCYSYAVIFGLLRELE